MKLLDGPHCRSAFFLLLGPLVNLLVEVLIDLCSQEVVRKRHTDIVKAIEKIPLLDPGFVARPNLFWRQDRIVAVGDW
jgi:hypothetical protein